jgi:ATP-dependent Clp protease ATP-binding subunit ClpC
MVDAFMAGAQNQGEFEARFNEVIAEVSHAGNVIIYIPEFQNILGSSAFNLDISGALIPYLKKGYIRIIAAVSPGAFKRFVEPLHSLLDSFTVINFDEPQKQEVLEMLFRKAGEIETKHKVIVTYKAIVAACEYAGRYVKEKALPGSAVTLLDDSANAARLSSKKLVEEQDIFDQVQKKVKVSVGEPNKEEKELLLNLEAELHKRVVSQNEAISAISESIRRLRSGIVSAKKPISFLFLGPTGVGKTETAKALADVYFGNSERLVRLDMSEFSGDDGMKRLLGSAPGEGDEKGQLTEPVYDTPYSLVLLDEFEKADQKILDLFLQVLDDGRLTDNKGKTVSFINTIIIATSNAASEFVREQIGKGVVVDKKFQSELLNFLQAKGVFKPELLNRFDDVIVFKPLGQEQITQIVKLMLLEVVKKLLEKDITVNFDDKVLQKIATDGFDKDFGARPLRRYIQDRIEDDIAQKMLKDEIKRGDKISVSVDTAGNIVINK